jgi:ribosomal protein S18 acetylase RimI-like enzyme
VLVKFKLLPEIVDRIVFAMEDQVAEYSIAVDTGEIVKEQGPHFSDRFTSIPPWRPIDGFQLMEKFVATLHNPIHRQRLREALDSGGRVFRIFKDELKRNSYIEQLWYRFKMAAMRQMVTEWYDIERRSRGLSQLGPEPEDIDDLLASEIDFGPAKFDELPQVAQLWKELQLDCTAPWKMLETGDEPMLVSVARCSKPEIIGFIVGRLSLGSTVSIYTIAVTPEFQGLGVGKALLANFVDQAGQRGVHEIQVDLYNSAQDFAALFIQQGFNGVARTLRLTIDPLAESSSEEVASGTSSSVVSDQAHPLRG